MALSNLPGPWHWEERDSGWWRVHESLNIEDGPHRERPVMIQEGEVVRTKTGTVLTQEDLQRLADEAEGGYDVSRIRERPGAERDQRGQAQ